MHILLTWMNLDLEIQTWVFNGMKVHTVLCSQVTNDVGHSMVPLYLRINFWQSAETTGGHLATSALVTRSGV